MELSKNLARRDIEVYSTMSETKAEFAERAIHSLKDTIYHYIEDHGEKKIHSRVTSICVYNELSRQQIDLGNHLEMSRILISSQF